MPMSLDVAHAQDSHAMAGSAPLGRGYELGGAVSQTLASSPVQSSLPSASQESQRSSASKHPGLSSSVDTVSDRQLTPTSSHSGGGSSSPQPAYLTSPNAAGGLPSYEPLESYRSSHEMSHSPAPLPMALPSYHVDQTAGQKRTSSGTLKSHRATASVEVERRPADYQRSRTTSSASRTSQVAELTAQLRQRLAYAKVKVQHGWESRTIDEIETITSMPTSPASVATNGSRPLASPYSYSNRERPGVGGGVERNGSAADRPLTAPSRHLNYGYPATNGHVEPAPVSHAAARGSLAPPVDFTHPRRTPNGTRHAPSLATNGSRSSLSASTSSTSHLPPTSPFSASEHHSILKTPSQRTMEQDAIETLIFMSSPGNSASFARQSATRQTPLGAELGAQQTRTISRPDSSRSHVRPTFPPARRPGQMTDGSTPLSPRKPAIEEAVLATANLHNNQGIDHALDEIRRRAVAEGEGADSSDEEER